MFGFDGRDDGILQLQVWYELQGTCGFTCEDCVPDIEISTAMRGDKTRLRARNPLDAGHARFVYRALRG